MTSAAGDMKSGTPEVHAAVAGRVAQADGYEIDAPLRAEVNVFVRAGGVGDGETEGAPVGVAVGVGEGAAPTMPGVAGLVSWPPKMSTATMAMAPMARGRSLFKSGILHGPSTTRCRRCSMEERTASYTWSWSCSAPSLRKASIRRSGSRRAVM